MSLMFALKLLADLCYYMFAVSSIASCAPHSGLLFTSPLIVAFSGYFVSRVAEKWPKKKWLRAIPLLLCFCAFFFTKTKADIVVTCPMILYLAFIAFRRFMTVDYDAALSRFFLCLKIVVGPLVLTLIASNGDGFVHVMLPYFFFFLVLNVVILRMLRHNEKVLTDRRFRIINFLQVGGLCAVGYFLSNGYLVMAAKWLGGMVAKYVLRPIFNGVLYIFGGFAWLLNKIFSGIKIDLSGVDLTEIANLGQNMDEQEQMMEMMEEEGNPEVSMYVTYVLIGIGVIVVIALVILLFKLLMGMARREEDNQFADEREGIGKDEDNPDKRLTHSRRDRVRNYYRKFLKLGLKVGLDPEANFNSREVGQAVRHKLSPTAVDGLRDVYIRARYSSEEITSEDVKQAKDMYDRLKG